MLHRSKMKPVVYKFSCVKPRISPTAIRGNKDLISLPNKCIVSSVEAVCVFSMGDRWIQYKEVSCPTLDLTNARAGVFMLL